MKSAAVLRQPAVRVAITGAGVVTPIGAGLDRFLESLRAGRQGVSRLRDVPVPRGKDAAGLLDAPELDGANSAILRTRAALAEAMEQARPDWGSGEETALIVSTGWGDSRAAERLYPEFVNSEEPSPEMLRALRVFPNGSILHALADELGLSGPRLVISNACASGNIALGTALDMIRLGRCRAAVVVGVENLNLTGVWGAERAALIGRQLRPFHRRRDGTILGEGAAAVILECGEDVGRDRILGWLEGFGCVCDKGAAAIALLEDGSGLRRSMGIALADAGRRASEIEYVSAHAPGTPLIDRIECKAIRDLLGPAADSVAVNATKSLTTYLRGASAIVEVVATLLQMRHGFLHGTAKLDEPDPDLAIEVIGPRLVERRVTRALSNACGGGGLSTTVLLTAPDEPGGDRSPARTPLPSSSADEIVITGLGSISTLGPDAPEPRRSAGRLDWFDIHRWYPEDTQFSYINRAAQLSAAAAAIAIADARFDTVPGTYASDRIAVLAGTYLGGSPQASAVLCAGLLRNPDAIRPSMSLDHGSHLGAALVCRYYGYDGPTHTLTGTWTAGLQALLVARDLLLRDRADAAVIIGFDSLDETLQRSVSWLDDCLPPERLSEGAGAVVLERSGVARQRCETRRIRLGGSLMLSGNLRSKRSLENVAGRLARSLSTSAWEQVYLCGSADPSLAELGGELIRRRGGSGEVRRLQFQTGFCMAGDALNALTAAAAAGERACILAAEPKGAVAALALR